VTPLAEQVARLTLALVRLKERIREAVAHEVGKVVADAVRHWVTAALQPLPDPDRWTGPEGPDRYDAGWDDEPEEWNREPAVMVRTPEPAAPPTRWAAALSVGAVATRWLIARRLPFVPSLGVGALAGVCALAGGPLVQSALAAASAAADLARIGRPEPRHA
jgi:hypothetical protein